MGDTDEGVVFNALSVNFGMKKTGISSPHQHLSIPTLHHPQTSHIRHEMDEASDPDDDFNPSSSNIVARRLNSVTGAYDSVSKSPKVKDVQNKKIVNCEVTSEDNSCKNFIDLTDQQIVQQSWDRLCQNFTVDDMGEELYKNVLNVLPTLNQLFTKPPRVLAVKFGQMFESLVHLHCSNNPTELDQRIDELALRHVDYGSRREHLPYFQAALTFTLESLTQGLSPEEEQAWIKMWDSVADLLMTKTESHAQNVYALRESWERIIAAFGGNFDEINDMILSHAMQQCPNLFKPNMGKQYYRHLKLLISGRTGGNMSLESIRALTAGEDPLDQFGGNSNNLNSFYDTNQSPPNSNENSFNVLNRQDKLLGEFTGSYSLSGAVEQDQSGISSAARRRGKNPLLFTSHITGGPGSEASKHIPQICNRLKETIDVLTDTGKLFSRRYDLALEWMRLPSPVEMADASRLAVAMELAIETLLSLIDRNQTCDPYTDEPWNIHENNYSSAWKWLLGGINKDTSALIKQIRVRAPILIRSWTMVTERISEVDLGNRFYEKLFVTAPDVKALFTRPQTQVGIMFAAVVAVLIQAVQDPLELANQLRKIAIMHIRFNVQPGHIPIFGKILVETVSEILDKDFTPEVHEAWAMLWERVAVKFYNIIQAGTNLVTRAMITGNADAVQRALDETPSVHRLEWACKIDLDGDFLSPLYWAIRDGKLAIAQVLLRDVLTIRKDVERMWYGCSLLFQAHPDLVDTLCSEAPPLLHDLLDGMVWRSRYATNGTRRIVYFVRELWGDPELPQCKSSYKSPIGCLVRLRDSELFCHPAVEFVIDRKWRLFGGLYFFKNQIILFAIVLTFILGFAINFGLSVSADFTSLGFRVACWVLSICSFVRYMIIGLRQYSKGEIKSYEVWSYSPNSKSKSKFSPDAAGANNTPASAHLPRVQSAKSYSANKQNITPSNSFRDSQSKGKRGRRTDVYFSWFRCCCNKRAKNIRQNNNYDEDDDNFSNPFGNNNNNINTTTATTLNVNSSSLNNRSSTDDAAKHKTTTLTISIPTLFIRKNFQAFMLFLIFLIISIPFDESLKVDNFGVDPVDPSELIDTARILSSIAGVFVFAMLIEISVAIPSMAAFLHAISRMSIVLIKFLCVLVMLMITFGTALTITVGHKMPNFETIWVSVFSLIKITLSLEYDTFDSAPDGPIGIWANILLLVYVIIACVLLLNLLIGQITTSYEFVAQRIDGLAKLDRAAVVIEVEDSMSVADRKTFFDLMNFKDIVPLDKHDTGLNGGVAVLVDHQLNSKEVLEDRVLRYSGTIKDNNPFSLADRGGANLRTTAQKIDWIFTHLQKLTRSNRGNDTYLQGGGNGAGNGSLLGGGGVRTIEDGSILETNSYLQ